VSAATERGRTGGAKQRPACEGDCESGSRYAAKDGTRDGSTAESAPALDLRSRFALRPGELADALGIGERTLRELAPELPRIRRGGVLLYPVDAIREWLRREARVEGDPLGTAAVAALAGQIGRRDTGER
jgi:hypothetical protein